MSLIPLSLTAIASQPHQDIELDNNDALIKRLNNIVLSISKHTRTSLDGSTIAAINSELDNIELLLGEEEEHTKFDDKVKPDQDSQSSTNVGDDDLRLSLIQESRMPVEPSPRVRSPPPWQSPSMAAPRSMDISKEADELASKLMISVQELQKRREESEVIPI